MDPRSYGPVRNTQLATDHNLAMVVCLRHPITNAIQELRVAALASHDEAIVEACLSFKVVSETFAPQWLNSSRGPRVFHFV